MDYGDLSYLLEAEYEQQLVALSQDAELMSLPIGTRSLSQGKVSLPVQTHSPLTAHCQPVLSIQMHQFHFFLAYMHQGTVLGHTCILM